MTGFATFVGDIREDLNRGTSYDNRIKRAIVSAVKFYRARRLAFNTKRGTFETNLQFTSLSADWLEVDSFKRHDGSGQKGTVTRKNWLWIEERDVTGATGQPIYYALQQGQLRLYPIPDQTYSFSLANLYAIDGPYLDSSDSFSNAWLVQGEELIKMHAMVDILSVYRGRSQEDFIKAQGLKAREDDIYRELKREYEQKEATGHTEAFL